MHQFNDRAEAGRMLARLLAAYTDRDEAIVMGLPRGGMPVAFEVARALHLPLDVMVVRKLRAPGQPELAIGAIASGGISILNEHVAQLIEDTVQLRAELQRQSAELHHRESLYRNDRLPLEIKRRTVILVDDGAATGASMRAAIRAARQCGAARVVAAVPVASSEALRLMRAEADHVVCALEPELFQAVGEWYRDFDQTDDTEVAALLAQSRAQHRRLAHPA
jgi:putative phosphoribosyl transferase